jgi:hypothetical protein
MYTIKRKKRIQMFERNIHDQPKRDFARHSSLILNNSRTRQAIPAVRAAFHVQQPSAKYRQRANYVVASKRGASIFEEVRKLQFFLLIDLIR